MTCSPCELPFWTAGSGVSITFTTTVCGPGMLRAADLPDLLRAAAQERFRAFGNRVTFSPKVFIRLTRLCNDTCGDCTFATSPVHVPSPFMSIDEVLSVARAGAHNGCHEALFTLGERPEDRYEVPAHGCANAGTTRPCITWRKLRRPC